MLEVNGKNVRIVSVVTVKMSQEFQMLNVHNARKNLSFEVRVRDKSSLVNVAIVKNYPPSNAGKKGKQKTSLNKTFRDI